MDRLIQRWIPQSLSPIHNQRLARRNSARHNSSVWWCGIPAWSTESRRKAPRAFSEKRTCLSSDNRSCWEPRDELGLEILYMHFVSFPSWKVLGREPCGPKAWLCGRVPPGRQDDPFWFPFCYLLLLSFTPMWGKQERWEQRDRKVPVITISSKKCRNETSARSLEQLAQIQEWRTKCIYQNIFTRVTSNPCNIKAQFENMLLKH